MAVPTPSRRGEHGTLIEKQCLVALLLILGAVFGPKWKPAFLLIPLGMALALLPEVLGALGQFRAGSLAARAQRALVAEGFTPDLVVKGKASEGGPRLVVDIGRRQLAFLTSEGTRVLGWSELREVALASYLVSQWGKGTWTRYGVRLTDRDGEIFGLSYPSQGRARRAYLALQGVLGAEVPFREALE